MKRQLRPTTPCWSARQLVDGWIIDPIDGIGPFARGESRFAVMVALLDEGETVSGWIWQPTDHRMYVAHRGEGAVCNDTVIVPSASPRRELNDMAGMFALPSLSTKSGWSSCVDSRGRRALSLTTVVRAVACIRNLPQVNWTSPSSDDSIPGITRQVR